MSYIYQLNTALKYNFIMILMTNLIGCQSSATHSSERDIPVDQSVVEQVHEGLDQGVSDECNHNIVESVSGLAFTDDGQAVAGAKAQACIILGDEQWICMSPVQSDVNGEWNVNLAAEYQCLRRLAVRLISPDGSSSNYCATENIDQRHDFGRMDLPQLEMTWVEDEQGREQFELLETESLLTHSSGLKIAVADPNMKTLLINEGAVSPISPRNDCLSQSHGFDYTFALTPEGFSNGTRLLFIPTPFLEAGQTLELYLVGGLYSELEDGTIIEEGSRHMVYQGSVSEGGLSLNLNLPFFTWIGIKVI